METHGRDLRFLVIFGGLMVLYYAVSTTAVVTDRCFPWYLRSTAKVAAGILNGAANFTPISHVRLEDKMISTDSERIAVDADRGSIEVARGCDAVAPTMLFLAAVIASPAAVGPKLLGLVAGTFVLMAVNIIRIVTLYLTRVHWSRAFDVMHLDIWQYMFILLAIVLWAAWASWANPPAKGAKKAA